MTSLLQDESSPWVKPNLDRSSTAETLHHLIDELASSSISKNIEESLGRIVSYCVGIDSECSSNHLKQKKQKLIYFCEGPMRAAQWNIHTGDRHLKVLVLYLRRGYFFLLTQLFTWFA